MNLLEETLDTIKKCNLSVDGITYIGSNDGEYQCTWEEFKKLADIEYDNGYGGREIAEDLIILFGNETRLYRSEYDGAEWWSCVIPIKPNTNPKKIKSLFTESKIRYQSYIKESNGE